MKLSINSCVKLNDGNFIPILGIGTWQATGKSVQEAVKVAIAAGYRHIDTASYYGNEKGIGKAVKESGIGRKDLFITTKIRNDEHNDPAAALDGCLKRLGVDYVDLYLIHWPVQERLETWKHFEKFRKQGLAKSIGVSNFTIRHLTQLLKKSRTVPAVNQVEFHPFLYQKELHEFCMKNKIALEAYAPLARAHKMNTPVLKKTAADCRKSPAQIMLRWAIQHGLVAIPKSVRPERIKENADIFDFVLSENEIKSLDNLNENFRTCWDPTDVP